MGRDARGLCRRPPGDLSTLVSPRLSTLARPRARIASRPTQTRETARPEVIGHVSRSPDAVDMLPAARKTCFSGWESVPEAPIWGPPMARKAVRHKLTAHSPAILALPATRRTRP